MEQHGSAILTKLTITSWSGSKFDKYTTKEVNDLKGTDNSVRVTKRLTKSILLGQLHLLEKKARDIHSSYTLLWDESGYNILPPKRFMGYMDIMADLQQQIEDQHDLICEGLDEIKEAAKKDLNGLYREEDYPSENELRSKLSFNMDLQLLPKDKKDYRLEIPGLPSQARKNIEEQIMNSMNEKHTQAVRTLIERAKEPVLKFIEKLQDTDKQIRSSLIDHIQDLVEIFPLMNYTDDELVNRLIDQLRTLVTDRETLSQPDVRAEYLERAKRLEQIFF